MAIVFPCHVCRTPLQAADNQAASLVRCPRCMTAVKVPAAQTPVAASVPVAVGARKTTAPPNPSAAPSTSTVNTFAGAGGFRPTNAGGKRYGFNCGYCSSRLEATESMAAQEGQCPTCGSTIVIPILDRYGRLIDPSTGKIIKQDPHPVHAYAAAGERAPQIVRQDDGKQIIRCPRCQAASPITANNCKACGMPFTMEGTTLEAAGASNGFCVASLVLGVIGLAAFCTLITPVLAIIFGAIGYAQASKNSEGGGKGMAIAGITLGVIGSLLSAWWLLK